MPETALVIAVPEAEPLVSEWRAQYDWSAQHDDELLGRLRELFASEAPVTFELPRVARFPDVAWLAPEPSEPFTALIELIAGRFPDYPPYEGAHDVVIPHLTVAEGGPELQDQVEAALTEHLPIAARADDVALLFEGDDGLWFEAHRFPLSG